MEVGAVKQAFNNEIILLKKNLNQAKIQTIHKLTRKAKTLTEKKAPEALKEKLKRKAESAVKEVLIIKKIKPRDIARFIVTHTGKLNEYLNKPIVNNDKACARLLLHKAMQDKYKLIRGKFSNISIKDLFMSRQERLKLKKEAKEKQKNKKKGKNSQAVNVEGDWDVEMTDTSKENAIVDDSIKNDDMSDRDSNENDDSRDNVDSASENHDSNDDDDYESNKSYSKNDFKVNNNNTESDDEKDDSSNENDKHNKLENKRRNNFITNDKSDSETSNDDEKTENIVVNTIKMKQPKVINNDKVNNINERANINNVNDKSVKSETKRVEKKHKENKNKNLNEKMQNRKFNKVDNVSENATKVVDPFFITSTGENYMSLVEPRQPDEIKEVHKQGNRQYRRAVMFGHVPKVKPRKPNFETKNDNRQDKFTNNNKNKTNHERNSFKKNDITREEVPEKLHPSWEAKKKQSAILPFKGKKIVFDEG